MIVMIRLRGEAGTRHDVRKTFNLLGMKRIYSVKLLEENPVNMGMIHKLDSFVAWGPASEETQKLVADKKGLKSPKGGLKSKLLHYPKGNLGNNGDKINDLIKRMV